MKKRLLPLIGLLAFSLTACGTKGDTGAQGPQGEQGVPGQNGQDGKDGTNGVDGKDGTSVLTGNGEPAASLGKDGDSYIDLDNWNYYVKENGSWVSKGNIKGKDGQNGQDGTNGNNGQDGTDGVDGQDGTSMLSGSGEPASNLGKDGDSYIDIATWDYYVKENGAWVLKGNIKAEDGQNGQDGADGVDGQDGTSMLSGNGEPASSLGKDGDSYIDIATWNYYVKENGTWVLKGNIKGSTGATGNQGVSITSTYIDTNGDLIVVLSDGTEINAGHIKDNPTYHTVTFDPNGGTSVASQQVKHLEKVAKPADPILEGYFLGSWRYGDEIWSFGGNVVTENMTLVANWLPKLNDLNIASEDTSKGTVSITDGSGYSDETITVTASAESNYVFKGWYNGYTKVSEDPAYTFTMPKEDYSLVAHFFSLDEDRYAKRPDISLDGKTMTYGLYPQSQVDSALESTLDGAKSSLTPDSNGWYLYEDTYYAEAGNNWFECEPIIWSIFSDNNSGEYTLLSKIALDSHCFYHDHDDRTIGGETIHPNNYEYSDVRSFLTNEFYNSAFKDDSYIKPTAISTSVTDNVFLLTLNEYLHNWNYPRKCEVSAWSRTRGIDTLGGSTCRYWARTPGGQSDWANIIYEGGGYGALDVKASYLGVRPAITLTLSNNSI